jgi:hypothetical protein
MAAAMQQREIGDAGELLKHAVHLLRMGLHPTDVVRGYMLSEKKVQEYIRRMCYPFTLTILFLCVVLLIVILRPHCVYYPCTLVYLSHPHTINFLLSLPILYCFLLSQYHFCFFGYCFLLFRKDKMYFFLLVFIVQGFVFLMVFLFDFFCFFV